MTDPAGPLSLTKQAAKVTLADSATFRTLVGAANQAEALAHIYTDALPPPAAGREHTLAELEAYRPFALLSIDPEGDGASATADAVGTGREYSWGGRIRLEIEQDIADDDAADPAEIALKCENTLGAIVAEMLELAGVAPYLSITSVSVGPVERSTDKVAATKGSYLVEGRIQA
ncbi:unnamed protein product [marine sediment metagenome]|uniref:Uncharacterized protein n=1 Tax=marine sediment metagenome TaxID=412755 RepID=X0YDT2_9ZZZZ